jgi:flagella basal body P-ring formation protein FlgA
LVGFLLGAWTIVALAQTETSDPSMRRIRGAVRAHVANTAHVEIEDVELRWLGLAAKVDCVDLAEVLVDSRPGEDFRGRTELRVTLVGETTECGRYRLPARIGIWETVPLVVSTVRSGDPVALELGRVNRDAIRGQSVAIENGPWIALRHLRAGDPVTDRDVRRPPEVFAGDEVMLTSGVPGLRLTAEARMLNDANIGDVVRVSNLATDSVVSGVLVDSSTVRVGGR